MPDDSSTTLDEDVYDKAIRRIREIEGPSHWIGAEAALASIGLDPEVRYLPSPEPVYADARKVRAAEAQRDRARDTATLLEGMIAEAVRILESADPSCPGAAIAQALAVLDPGA